MTPKRYIRVYSLLVWESLLNSSINISYFAFEWTQDTGKPMAPKTIVSGVRQHLPGQSLTPSYHYILFRC